MATTTETTQDQSRRSVLSLQTITVFPTIDINGQFYKLIPKDAIPLFEVMKLERNIERFGQLFGKPSEAYTPDDEHETVELLKIVVRQILEAPEDVLVTLTDTQRLLIVQAFTELPAMTRQAPEARTARSSNGGKPSRGSRASTKGRALPNGGARFRSDSSKPATP